MNKILLTIIITTFIAVTGIFFAFKPKLQNNEVVFWTLQMSDFAPYMNEVISNFEQENPQIKIKWVDVPFSEGEKRTLASVLSDNPPDLVNLNPDFSSTLANKGALWEIDEQHVKQFNPEIINSTRTNGKIYSLPWYATSAITIYNKKLLSSVPKTYEQMADLAPSLRNKNTYITLPNITENDTMLKILNKYGCSCENLNSKECIEIFDMFKKLYDNDLIPKETVTMTLQEALEKYMSGNIALISAGANFLSMIKENAPQIYNQTDVAPQLTGSIGQNDFSLMNFVIPLRAKHKEDALKFALFLTNEENQLKLAKQTNILAVNKKALNNEFYTKYDKNDLMSKARVISAKQLNKLHPTFKTQKNQKEINNLVNNAIQSILLNKDSTENILNNIKKELKIIGE
ncbi:extracellular solute-binding protein [bacterium]|nr:extracellular solute-binding protein [bacterium]